MNKNIRKFEEGNVYKAESIYNDYAFQMMVLKRNAKSIRVVIKADFEPAYRMDEAVTLRVYEDGDEYTKGLGWFFCARNLVK